MANCPLIQAGTWCFSIASTKTKVSFFVGKNKQKQYLTLSIYRFVLTRYSCVIQLFQFALNRSCSCIYCVRSWTQLSAILATNRLSQTRQLRHSQKLKLSTTPSMLCKSSLNSLLLRVLFVSKCAVNFVLVDVKSTARLQQIDDLAYISQLVPVCCYETYAKNTTSPRLIGWVTLLLTRD